MPPIIVNIPGYRLYAFKAPGTGAGGSTVPTSELADSGRTIWAIDWEDFQLGILGTNQRQHVTNAADNLYNLTLKQNLTHYSLESITSCPILEDHNRHLIIKNFSEAAPTLT